MKKRVTIICGGFLCAWASCATTLTFDDVDASGGYVAVPSGYGGLTWDNFLVFEGDQYPGTGYQHGVVSSKNGVFDDSGYTGYMGKSGGTTFSLNSAYMTAAWNDEDVDVSGYKSGKQLYDITVSINTATPTLINFSFDGVDEVKFRPSTTGLGNQFVLDNVTISNVPDAGATAALLGGAIAGLGLLRKRLANSDDIRRLST